MRNTEPRIQNPAATRTKTWKTQAPYTRNTGRCKTNNRKESKSRRGIIWMRNMTLPNVEKESMLADALFGGVILRLQRIETKNLNNAWGVIRRRQIRLQHSRKNQITRAPHNAPVHNQIHALHLARSHPQFSFIPWNRIARQYFPSLCYRWQNCCQQAARTPRSCEDLLLQHRNIGRRMREFHDFHRRCQMCFLWIPHQRIPKHVKHIVLR